MDTSSLTGLTGKTDAVKTLEETLTGATGSLPRGVDTSSLTGLTDLTGKTDPTSVITEVTDTVTGATKLGGIRRGLLDSVDSLPETAEGVVSHIESLLSDIEKAVTSLVSDLESVDVDAALADIESLVNKLLTDIQAIPSNDGLDLSSILSLTSITSQITSIESSLGDLVSLGVVSDLIAEIDGILQDIIRLLTNIL